MLTGTGGRKELIVAFMFLPCTSEVHLTGDESRLPIKCLSCPQHFTTHLGY